MTLDIHLRSLESLRRSITLEQFEKAVDSIAGARRILVFGIGPSSAIADYLVVQLGRFGLDAASLPITWRDASRPWVRGACSIAVAIYSGS